MSSSDKSPVTTQGVAPTPAVVTPPSQAQQSLSLPPVEELRRAPTRLDTARRHLWLCIYLPRLPLDALYRDGGDGGDQRARVRAVYEEQQGIRRILIANAIARAAGIGAGLSLNAALSLMPGLELEARNEAVEAQLLQRLAIWAQRFTSFVVIEPGGVLLLEIAGSLRLFEGSRSLSEQVARGLGRQGLDAVLAIAPTPLASTWLARSGREATVEDPGRLSGHLGPLPLSCLDWPGRVTETLRGMGVTCVADCLRLPREGFARRFGAGRLNEFDRALGRLPDPRKAFVSPQRFKADAELDAEDDDSEHLLHVCEQLLGKLERFLRSRQTKIQRLRFTFFHRREDGTHLELGCVQAGQGIDHWSELLRLRFERIALPAPVIAIRLCGGTGQRSSLETSELAFAASGRAGGTTATSPISGLLERLSARMGDAAVHGLTTVAEHRPQHAWRPAAVSDDTPRCANPARVWNAGQMPELLSDLQRTNRLLLQRPLWILDRPERLDVFEEHPCYHGRLRLLGNPERLESGWWDEDGIARDYFVAEGEEGVRLWIYQDRSSRRWYLHGIFG